MNESKIVNLNEYAQKLRSLEGDEIVCEIELVTSDIAAQWLKANRLNRRIRKGHVAMISNELSLGNWQLNGQPIVISDDESILDGQHRLLGVIDSGIPMKTLVVYGVSKEVFLSMDTGIPRSGGDGLQLTFGIAPGLANHLSTAVKWANSIDYGTLARYSNSIHKMSNTEIVKYHERHPKLLQCVDMLTQYASDARPMAVGPSAALYYQFDKRSRSDADTFMHLFFSGEELKSTDSAYVIRAILSKNATSMAKFSYKTKMAMVIKAWNIYRRNLKANRSAMMVSSGDSDKVTIY